VLEDGELRKRLGGQCVEFARQHRWEAIALQQEAIYHRVAKRRQ
jgi:hypothetical protein